ncbi:hypothetical protein J2Y58_003885 [Sphingomonas sp. BE138]|uniref:hypothetical protein n=1 Tax=Sphingomonas sp. BE138 TaxID=2817845 RepID=UPI0028661413|nr:hypothetical protein [Sphingomonas sp. BE138]MDR6790502.1 hypothetical protein [Sphingomonas sp. BE138]
MTASPVRCSRGDGMHVAHTSVGWVVFDNGTARPGRLSAPYPTRAGAIARKRALARALRRQRAHDA